MIAAFTGTQAGMTDAQRQRVRAGLTLLRPTIGIHGDCIGADADFHAILVELGVATVIYPCTIEGKRAHCCLGPAGGTIHVPQPPLERNRIMVRRSAVLIATPKGFAEELRSGTWATIRYARRLGRPIRVVWPDGRLGDGRAG